MRLQCRRATAPRDAAAPCRARGRCEILPRKRFPAGPGVRMQKRMGEAVARVARRVNDTVENKSDSLELNLEGNYLHRLPEEVGSLPHLRAINLSRNRFQHFPEPLAAVGALETIELEENEIAGASRLGSKAAEAFNSPSGRFPAPAEH
nr:PREDICTED: leucine-rich repeat-containing protein 20 isoform X2 [Apteryx mantelli mantelli]